MTEEDVVCSIEFARNHQPIVAVRSGGHSFAGQGVWLATANDNRIKFAANHV